MGGFKVEGETPFEKLIHHKAAFAVISVLGGVFLLLGIVAASVYTGQNTTRTNGNPVHAGDTPVRQDTGADNGTPAAADASAVAATPTPAPLRQYDHAPPFTIDPTATYTMTIHTEKGDIVVALDAKAAPQTVNNIVFLAQNHFYDGLSFQRVVPGQLVQTGATQQDGTGGAGYTVPIEDSPLQHVTGALATALTASKGNSWEGSQFYICLQPIPLQNGKDTVFGMVTQGLDILQSLPGRSPDQATSPGLAIQSVTVSKS